MCQFTTLYKARPFESEIPPSRVFLFVSMSLTRRIVLSRALLHNQIPLHHAQVDFVLCVYESPNRWHYSTESLPPPGTIHFGFFSSAEWHLKISPASSVRTNAIIYTNMRQMLSLAAFVVCLLIGDCLGENATKKPHIIFILVDDMVSLSHPSRLAFVDRPK